MRIDQWISVLTVAAFGMVPAARAALIANPGFETEAPAGCAVNCVPASWTLNAGASVDMVFPNSGTYDIAIGTSASQDPGTLSQTIMTTPGQAYTLSFAVFDESGLPSDTLTVTLGTFTTTLDGLDVPPGGYSLENFVVPGAAISSASTRLLFAADTSLSGQDFNIDDVALQANVVATPEPWSWAILATALLAVVTLRPGRRTQA